MNCDQARALMHADIDHELDPRSSHELNAHVARCEGCTDAYRNLQATRDALRDPALRYRAPEGLARELRMRLGTDSSQHSTRRWRQPMLALAAGVAFAAVIGLAVILQIPMGSRTVLPVSEMIDAHVHSLMADHLTDVASSDRHTVKPWFNSRVDFSPEVRDLTTDGYPLVGGRLEYTRQRTAVALVYRHRQHIINLMIWPETAAGDKSRQAFAARGYNVFTWNSRGMRYWAISDLNAPELEEFTRLVNAKP